MKTEVQIYTDVIGIMKPLLPSDWELIRGYQPHKTGISDKLITLTKVSGRRYGFQYRNYDVNRAQHNLLKQEKFLREIVFQFSALNKDRRISTAFDVMEELITSINRVDVIQQFISLGYGLQNITDIRELEFENDESNYQVELQFDLTLILEQVKELQMPFAESLSLETYYI